ncbi:hypothetical protein [Kitasatospora aureofaciens]|uniref:hypothetical protein n=1 Tax=Kitasatospora aureofaciens TaxID=1894 RepID=UPI0006910E6A|nr:hypothetical protein [Kitasatospora aureofaciens]
MITDAAQESAPEQGVLVTSRPLDEYCTLFGLTRARLAALPGPPPCPARCWTARSARRPWPPRPARWAAG